MTPPAIVPGNQWSLLPGTARVKGVNIAPRDKAIYTTGNLWWDLWSSWPWSGTTGIKNQIDRAVAVYGCNTIRMLGSQSVRTSNSWYAGPYISLSTYLGQWQQALDYIRAQGLYAYPCLGTDSNYAGSGVSWVPDLTWYTNEMVACVRFLQQYADIIIGVDLINERMTNSGGTFDITALYNTVKAAAPKLKYTYSTSSISSLPAVGACDYLDVHNYANQTASYFDSTLSGRSVPVLIGEFGLDVDAGSTARQAAFNAQVANANYAVSARRLAGGIAWSAMDQDSTAGNLSNFGVLDSSGNARSDISTIFASFPS